MRGMSIIFEFEAVLLVSLAVVMVEKGKTERARHLTKVHNLNARDQQFIPSPTCTGIKSEFK